jgi:hypothetical protein
MELITDYKGFELEKVVAIYKIYREDAPKDLAIEVVQHQSGKYSAYSTYSFWGPDQADSYQNNNPCDSEIESVKHVIGSLNMFYNISYRRDEYCWVPFRSNSDNVILGTGEVIDKKNFIKKSRG